MFVLVGFFLWVLLNKIIVLGWVLVVVLFVCVFVCLVCCCFNCGFVCCCCCFTVFFYLKTLNILNIKRTVIKIFTYCRLVLLLASFHCRTRGSSASLVSDM